MLNFGLHGSLFILAHPIQNLLPDLFHNGIGRSRIIRHVKLDAVNGTLRGAAAIGNLAHDRVGLLQVLIADSANCIVRSTSLLANLREDFILPVGAVGEIESTCQILGGGTIPLPVAPSEAASAAKQRKQNQIKQTSAASKTILTGVVPSDSSNISCAHVIHARSPFMVYYVNARCVYPIIWRIMP